ncbi:type II and III secretion system protein family protein [Rubellimicrobium aerolatum]|uniref:Type II and III secretion system protein family protein n=1 Tax=Rubellimicrobium aerolatum TaxID=490979 RepID=A0ABW0SG61_9RHOB|nr:type II and III secretion system protein family protein [Rubellimicrobium aerolatum]MBP1807140.1 pilus assembly protein CpaC [Rubellimicrobium aerolatum]
MTRSRLLRAALAGLALVCASSAIGRAQTLTVLTDVNRQTLEVPLNRAEIVESDVPFTELSIANPGIADISSLTDRTIYVLGKSPGRTTLTILGAEGRLIANVEVQVTPDMAEFKERLQQILPGQRIEVRTAADGIVLSGTVDSAADLDRALELANRYAPDRVSNLLTVGGTQQVMLQVRFAEMQRSVSKSLSSSLALGGSGQLGSGRRSREALSGLAPVPSGDSGAVVFGFGAGGLEVGLLLEALEEKGLVRTLAEPNLTALSGQEAHFLAGGEYPVPVAQSEGNISVEYKPFGVELNFTPRVVEGDLVNLDLRAAVSSIDPTNGVTQGGFTVDAFRRRETSTTVEMRDGESFAIAGLLSDDFRDIKGQVPWLGDIPVLGALFRSSEYERNQTELVIIVTPHLVTPTRGETLALPTDRVRPPSETDLFLFGRDSAPRSGGAGEVARQDFSGSYGYVMD